MKERILDALKSFGVPRIIIVIFLVGLWIVAITVDIPFFDLLYDCIVRTGMWVILALAMLPGIRCGIGLNFGLSIGILAGLVGMLVSIETDFSGFAGFIMSIVFAAPVAVLFGVLYGMLLNRVKGSEMMVSTYTGFAMVSLMSIGWLVLPFNAPEMAWPIGVGVRVTISIERRFSQILNDFGRFRVGDLAIPTGLLLFIALICLLYWLYFRTRSGSAMLAVGDNPRYAESCGISVDHYRIIGTVMSTVAGAVGIVVYAQSFGFIQLYQAPLMMGFPAVACILIGGATIKKASIFNVILGTFLFQSILVTAQPVANEIAGNFSNVAEITRLIIQNGIILYALAQTPTQG